MQMTCGLQPADIDVYQGDDWAGDVTVLDCFDGKPADLTGYRAAAQIRRGPADQTGEHVMAEMTCAVVPVPDGEIPHHISLSLSHRETRHLRQSRYRWDLQIVAPTGEITTLLAGDVRVTPEVTREHHHDAPIEDLLYEERVIEHPRERHERELEDWHEIEADYLEGEELWR